MADIITNFFLTPVANRIAATQTKKLAPSLIELGADALTRNPQREAVARLFSPASSNSLIARLDSFLAAQTPQNNSASSLKNNLKSTTGLRTANDTGVQAQDVFARRETGAELRLKELLKPPAATTGAATQTPAEETPSPPAIPAITRNAGLRVAEGGSALLDSSRLRAGDADTRPQDIVFTVDDDGPRHGQLELVSKPGEAVTSFTQRDLDIGRIRYVSDGSEFTTDSFKFTVSDGTSETRGSFAISISPVNDTPETAVNTGLTVAEGGSAAITATQLSARDPDGLSETTVFDITSGPANGRLEINGSAVTSFTQADLQAGRVTYVNNGSENASDSFTFRISDGAAVSPSATFDIDVTPVDDAPVLANNTGAALNEGGTATITSAQLRLTDVDTASQDLAFTVTAAPANGRLELSTNPGASVTSFTQADIDAGRLRFVHNGSETTTDSFSFTARDGTTTLGSANFSFTVAPVNDAPTLVNNGATVAEGGSRVINTNSLRATDPDSASSSLVYTVTTAPTNGRLENTQNAGVAITSFTQDDLAAGRVRFVHDGSETTAASFGFSLSDGQATLANNTFNFSVTPVNDAPVVAANTGTAVNRRSSTIIASSQLRATDADSANLTYTISRAPARGRLELTTDPGVSITSFTQADLDAGRVRYVHTSTRNTDDTFRFRVTDGAAQTGQQTFRIDVR